MRPGFTQTLGLTLLLGWLQGTVVTCQVEAKNNNKKWI